MNENPDCPKGLSFDLDACKKLATAYHDNPRRINRGDVIEWKPGLKCDRFPDYGEPVLVLDVLECPVEYSECYAALGTPMEAERKDIKVACLSPSGALAAFMYDSKRFKHAE